MTDRTSVTPREVFAGHGMLARNGVEVPVTSFRLERGTYSAADEWQLTAEVAHAEESRVHELLASGPGHLSLRGETTARRYLGVNVIHLDRMEGRRLEAVTQEVALGESQAGWRPGRQYVDVSLSPTPLARPKRDDLVPWPGGEIKPLTRRREHASRVAVPTALGEATFVLDYTFESAEVEGEPALLRVPVASLRIDVRRDARSADVGGITDRLTADLGDALQVMSFLGRRVVRWRRIRVISRRGVRGSHAHHGYERLQAVRAGRSGEGRSRQTPLVNPYRLPAEALSSMIARYRALPYKESAAAAIVYLGAAQTADTVDARLAFGFTALEALVSGTGEYDGTAYALSAAEAKALGKRLKPEIRAFAAEREMSERDLDAVLKKLAELRRRPITDRLVDLITRLEVEWRDLWAHDVSLADGFAASYGRRNRFVHAGQLGHVLQASVDGQRAVLLSERLLFRLLGGNVQWYDPRAFENARYLVEDEQLVRAGVL